MSGTRLSPWLAFGCVTARQVMRRVQDCERRHGKVGGGGRPAGKSGSTGARLHTELNFRDFLRFATYHLWGRTLFHLAGPFGLPLRGGGAVAWRRDFEGLERWRRGATGFPFVDAGMRELRRTGYMSHLHRQCCAAFLVRDLQIDWRWGAEHFESCLVDYTPDANWGNWAYRILPRPGLAISRESWLRESHEGAGGAGKKGKSAGRGGMDAAGSRAGKVAAAAAAAVPDVPHISTMECVVWPVVHDCKLEHTLFWCPELSKLPSADLRREPWRVLGDATRAGRRIAVKPYKDSPLWFCAANRVNWGYEYSWLPGGGYVAEQWQEQQVGKAGKAAATAATAAATATAAAAAGPKNNGGAASCGGAGEGRGTGSESGDPACHGATATGTFVLGRDYPFPLVRPVNIEVRLDKLPVRGFAWGDSDAQERPHVKGLKWMPGMQPAAMQQR
jgi:hypothetical protein